jgi:hypothetical protein
VRRVTVQEDPYVRVYYRALTDEKFRGLTSDAWGHWVRLLVIADGMYPAPAPLPRWVKAGPLRELETSRIVAVEGEYFRIVGMDPERAKRSEAATFAADVKHRGLEEALRRRSERAEIVRPHPDASGRSGMGVRNDAPQRNGRAVSASPLRSAPIQSAPLRSEPAAAEPTVLKNITTKKKPTDEEEIDRLLDAYGRQKRDNLPGALQVTREALSNLGIHDPDAALTRRVA